MSRRLVICCDGTWNTPDQKEEDRACPTNVVKMARAILPQAPDGTPQVVFYHEGVGTSAGLDHVTGGAFGVGLSKLIEDTYRFLVDNYVDRDDLYFFGFSRGAYAVRSTAGLIRNCGILQKLHADRFPEAYGLYRRDDADAEPEGREAIAFRRAFSREVKIKFIGVWDTVGALGIPGHLLGDLAKEFWEFHDVKLSRIVENAYQALAIDEKREDFKPTLWEQQAGATNQTLEQVWFAGVHCNVGGGYQESGLSDSAFLWMKKKAAACGLAFDQEYIDKIIKPNPLGELRDSRTGIFHLRRGFVRPIGSGTNTAEAVHARVKERMDKDPTYKPENLVAYVNKGGKVTPS